MGIGDLRHDYDTAGLDMADLDPDPLAQWRQWYDDTVAAGCVEPNAMVVATVDAEGRPDARAVLVRGVDERGLWFFTNLQSTKGRQVAAVPAAALVFNWLELHRQVRLRGAVEAVADATVDAYFASRPRAARIASWASPQSAVLPDRAALDALVADAEARFPGEEVPRPPHVGGLRVVPDEVEFWQGRAARLHDRLRYRRAGRQWIIERLAP
jgi:pyridoxamine 5'-phosphate oxidase